MNLFLTKPDALGDQLIAAGLVQELLSRRADIRVCWHLPAGREAIAPLLDAAVFTPDWRNAPPEAEAARLAASPARLTLLPFPLASHEPWSDDLRRRLAWWNAFLRATTWDAVVLGLVSRNWVGDFTAIAAPAPRRFGFSALPMRQPLVNEAGALAGTEAPAFTAQLAPSFDRSEAAQLLDLFALVEPSLSTLATPPVWRPATTLATSARPAGAPRRIALAPGVGGDARRAWPLANFLALADALRASGDITLQWIEGPGDAPFLASLPASEQLHRLAFGPDDLAGLGRTLADVDLLVCHDTAYAHLAAGLGLPTVALYGGGQGSRFHPLNSRAKVVQGLPACAGCQWHCLLDRLHCVTDIPVETVRTAVTAALAGDFSPIALQIETPLAPAPALTRRLQEEILLLNADRFARLQIIQSLLAPPAPPPAPRPILSVIVPMGRPERAAATLASLAAQEPIAHAWELVLVGTQAPAVARAHPHLPIVPVSLERPQLPSRTRFLGVERARGDWFLFVDDDVELAPDFFRRCLTWIDAPASGTPGCIGPRLPGRSPRFFGRVTDYANFWAQQDGAPEDRDWLYSAAILVRARAYHDSGGFNPDLPNGEDVDLTRRILAAGHRVRYEPALVAWHNHGRDTFAGMCRYFWRNGNAARYFFAHHGGACCFSLRAALGKPWSDLKMNRDFRARHRERLGILAPWALLAYHIVEASLEYHYQRHLWESRAYATLPARTRADRTYVRSMECFARGHKIRGATLYGLAMILELAHPVRR